jgi:hypothetical protein
MAIRVARGTAPQRLLARALFAGRALRERAAERSGFGDERAVSGRCFASGGFSLRSAFSGAGDLVVVPEILLLRSAVFGAGDVVVVPEILLLRSAFSGAGDLVVVPEILLLRSAVSAVRSARRAGRMALCARRLACGAALDRHAASRLEGGPEGSVARSPEDLCGFACGRTSPANLLETAASWTHAET